MTAINSNTMKAHDAQVVLGIQKHLLNVPSLPLAGAAYTPAELVKLVQSRIDSAGIVAAADATWHSTVTAHEALSAKVTPVLRGLRQYVLNAFGETSAAPAERTRPPPRPVRMGMAQSDGSGRPSSASSARSRTWRGPARPYSGRSEASGDRRPKSLQDGASQLRDLHASARRIRDPVCAESVMRLGCSVSRPLIQ